MTGRVLRSITAIAAAWLLSAGVASAQAPVMAVPTISGNNVTFTWSATAGATGYRLDYGVASGAYLNGLTLGNVTQYSVGAPNGTFFLRVVALPGNEISNEIRIQVPSPPAAPTNLQVARNGTGLVATWTPGVGGNAADFYQIQIGVTPGTTIYTSNVTNAGWGFPAGVPAGTYYVRAVAVNATGNVPSAPSPEVVVTMPAGGACDPALSDFTAQGVGGLLSLNWTPLPGVSNVLNVSLNGGVLVTNFPLTFATGRFNYGYVGTGPNSGILPNLGVYDLAVTTAFSCGSQAQRTVTVNLNGAPAPGTRTADPAPGQLLPVPNYVQTVVTNVANRRPDLLRNSCVDTGGNNRFMFEVVKELRALDNRWGLNVKRGYQGLSQDIVVYNRSALQDEGATTGPTAATANVALFDIIGGHCGSAPSPNWTEVTQATINGGARAVLWLGPYLDAGYKP
ncbi:MAG: hypothetical protein U0P30_14850 [Vicinamibacterales bacterium]